MTDPDKITALYELLWDDDEHDWRAPSSCAGAIQEIVLILGPPPWARPDHEERDEQYERQAARDRANDFDRTSGKDWT
jgi:hypothetical protein